MTNPIPVEGLSEDVRMTLADCPIGLFVADRAGLCLKTEYGNNEGRIDAYIVSSGEFFWGDAPQTIASQRAQLVTPVSDVTELQHRREAEAGVQCCMMQAGAPDVYQRKVKALETIRTALASRSSDEQAEVVAYEASYQKGLVVKMLTYNRGDAEAYVNDMPNGAVRALYASPSGVKAGVTEEMVTRGCEEADWLVDPAAWKSDPIEAERITSAYRSGMRAILTAALVGDEGMGEGWQPIETARKVVDETVLLRIEHINYAIAAADDKHRWEELCTAYWTDFNSGGWVWHGLAGQPTHWCAISGPTPPIQGDAK